jgi:pyridoxal phosphate enzyme (YggS family)
MTDFGKSLALVNIQIQELSPHKKVTIVAVSKYTTEDAIINAYKLGHRDFGENKVQDLKVKAQNLQKDCPEIRWHFIGHLQSNKVKDLFKIPNLTHIHSIDSLKILNECQKIATNQKFFLQINISQEPQKSGFTDMNDALAAKKLLKENYLGLMGMGASDDSDPTNAFLNLLDWQKNLSGLLSMGMSDDYKIALKLGSNFLRLGSVLFGNNK